MTALLPASNRHPAHLGVFASPKNSKTASTVMPVMDFLPMREAMRALGVSRQTVLQRVRRGELAAVHVMRGKQKGLRIKVIGQQPALFNPISGARGHYAVPSK